jgi:cytochrome c
MRGADTTKASLSKVSAGPVALGAGAKLPGGAPAAESVAIAVAAAKPVATEVTTKNTPVPSKEAAPGATKIVAVDGRPPLLADGRPPLLADIKPAMDKSACLACHGLENKAVGPSFKDIAAKYKGRADGVAYLGGKIKAGGQGVWGAIPMPAQTISEADAKRVAAWIMAGIPK